MHLAGADEIYVLGGVQAVAALALGTETIAPVDFLAGPGNAYVAEAKRQLFGEVGIDLLAGPDRDPDRRRRDCRRRDRRRRPARAGGARPDLARRPVTTSQALAEARARRDRGVSSRRCRPRRSPARAWRDHGEIERRRVARRGGRGRRCATPSSTSRSIPATRAGTSSGCGNYGALFLGEATTVAYGDKTIGTNHVLPTGGRCALQGGLWVGKFLKTVTYQECDPRRRAS